MLRRFFILGYFAYPFFMSAANVLDESEEEVSEQIPLSWDTLLVVEHELATKRPLHLSRFREHYESALSYYQTISSDNACKVYAMVKQTKNSQDSLVSRRWARDLQCGELACLAWKYKVHLEYMLDKAWDVMEVDDRYWKEIARMRRDPWRYGYHGLCDCLKVEEQKILEDGFSRAFAGSPLEKIDIRHNVPMASIQGALDAALKREADLASVIAVVNHNIQTLQALED